MISVEEARRRLLAPLVPLGAEQVAVSEAAGRVLAEDVAARRTQPPWDVSAMDGYAVRAGDVASVPARLKVVGSVPAGQAYGGTVGRGEAVRIFTGAPMPWSFKKTPSAPATASSSAKPRRRATMCAPPGSIFALARSACMPGTG